MNKKQSRIRRSIETRARLKRLGKTRLCVYKTPQHIYAQIISSSGDSVITAASTVEAVVKEKVSGHKGNCEAAKVVGQIIAERAKEKGVSEVSFDRSGFKYHGRLKALADSARENGLNF